MFSTFSSWGVTACKLSRQINLLHSRCHTVKAMQGKNMKYIFTPKMKEHVHLCCNTKCLYLVLAKHGKWLYMCCKTKYNIVKWLYSFIDCGTLINSGCCENNHRHLPSINVENSLMLCQEWQERYHVSSQLVQTAPISPTTVLLVMLLVSWPGRQNDEVSREVIPICSSDYFPNSHLILPTTHQQGARQRVCGSCLYRGQERRRWRGAKKGEGWKGEKIKHKRTNGKHKRGERKPFQFEGDEKSTMISPVCSEGIGG